MGNNDDEETIIIAVVIPIAAICCCVIGYFLWKNQYFKSIKTHKPVPTNENKSNVKPNSYEQAQSSEDDTSDSVELVDILTGDDIQLDKIKDNFLSIFDEWWVGFDLEHDIQPSKEIINTGTDITDLFSDEDFNVIKSISKKPKTFSQNNNNNDNDDDNDDNDNAGVGNDTLHIYSGIEDESNAGDDNKDPEIPDSPDLENGNGLPTPVYSPSGQYGLPPEKQEKLHLTKSPNKSKPIEKQNKKITIDMLTDPKNRKIGGNVKHIKYNEWELQLSDKYGNKAKIPMLYHKPTAKTYFIHANKQTRNIARSLGIPLPPMFAKDFEE